MFGIRPIEVFSINDFRIIEEWSIPNGASKTISFILTKNDSLGERRYIPASGATVQIKFMRARAASSTAKAVTLTKSAIPKPEDRSMFDVSLTAQDTETIISGGVHVVVTESGSSNNFNVPYLIRKVYADPGY